MGEILKENMLDKNDYLGKAEDPNLGSAGNIPSNGEQIPQSQQSPPPPQTDFKIAEIWIRSGNIMIDAPKSFWADRCRALGVMEYCKDIIKTAQAKKPEEKIIKPSNYLNGVRNIFKRRK